jgi:hypothetical protein
MLSNANTAVIFGMALMGAVINSGYKSPNNLPPTTTGIGRQDAALPPIRKR